MQSSKHAKPECLRGAHCAEVACSSASSEGASAKPSSSAWVRCCVISCCLNSSCTEHDTQQPACDSPDAHSRQLHPFRSRTEVERASLLLRRACMKPKAAAGAKLSLVDQSSWSHLQLLSQDLSPISHECEQVEADLCAGVALYPGLDAGLHPVQPVLLSAQRLCVALAEGFCLAHVTLLHALLQLSTTLLCVLPPRQQESHAQNLLLGSAARQMDDVQRYASTKSQVAVHHLSTSY